ncbi:Hypothetical_protein [Hexamita inflata]|uniref:Hypothetical_protein n=1 Tax=Hexamita inflata TaxID=28002 RepID=A0AA86TJS8_9EUKA|nr:Hypothetical protein HINF_LOCUS7185 [Hexamita inflata]
MTTVQNTLLNPVHGCDDNKTHENIDYVQQLYTPVQNLQPQDDKESVKEKVITSLSLGDEFKLIMKYLDTDEIIDNKIDDNIDKFNRSQKDQQKFDLEIHSYLQNYLKQQRKNQKIKTLLVQMVTLKMNQGEIQSLEDLLLTLKIEIFSEVKNRQNIVQICQAIKMINPVEVIDYLNTQFADLLPPYACHTMEVFKVQLSKICSIDVQKNLDKILKLPELKNQTNIETLCDTNEDEFKELGLNRLNANYLFKYLQYYKAISVPFQIYMKTDYKDISKLTVEELMTELENKVLLKNEHKKEVQNLKSWNQFKNQLQAKNTSLDNILDFNILRENRLEKNTLKSEDFVILTINGYDEEKTVFSNACVTYSQLFNNIIKIKAEPEGELEYIGWQEHWETVIDYVQDHVLSESLQPFDLLCVMGGPRSGKTSSMVLSAIFMSFFVDMIRPQKENRHFQQKFTKIIKIDCKEYESQELYIKMQSIYDTINILIPQTVEHQDKFKLLLQTNACNGKLANVLLAIQDMFINAKCYFVVYWDEIQFLKYENFVKISDSDERTLGNFYKALMVSLYSPCQHLMSASLSVALLTILQAVPVNGKDILGCRHAIVTSSKNSEMQLNLVSQVQKLKQDNLDILKQTCNILKEYRLPCTCANVKQVLTEFNQEKNLKQNLQQNVKYHKEQKNKIALTWIDESITSMTKYHKEIYNLMVGTATPPGLLLEKLCYFDKETDEYTLRDTSLLSSMKEKFKSLNQNTLVQNEYTQVMQTIILQDLGNMIQELNCSSKKQRGNIDAQVNNIWKRANTSVDDKIVNNDIQKDNTEKDQQFKKYFCHNAELGTKRFLLTQAKRTQEQNNDDKRYYMRTNSPHQSQIDTYDQSIINQNVLIEKLQKELNDFKKITNKQQIENANITWKSGVQIIKMFQNAFCHNTIEWKLTNLNNLAEIISRSNITLADVLKDMLKIIQPLYDALYTPEQGEDEQKNVPLIEQRKTEQTCQTTIIVKDDNQQRAKIALKPKFAFTSSASRVE